MEEIKTCPYCGGHNIYVDGYDHAAGKRWRVVCLDCMATVDDGTTQQKYRAIEKWNRRVPDIVRCGECERFDNGSCKKWSCSGNALVFVKNNSYCSFGERRESEGKIDGN